MFHFFLFFSLFWELLQAQLIAQSIGQAFSVAYQEFLRANGINPEDLSQKEYSDLLNTQDMYNDDLIHFSKSENCKDVCILFFPHKYSAVLYQLQACVGRNKNH